MGSRRAYAACGLVVALGLVLGLVGCSGGDDPPLTSTTSGGSASSASSVSSAGTGSTTTTSPPTVDIPAAAKEHTPAGAEAFVRFYLEQVNLAWTRPRAGVLPALSEAECIACKAFEASAADLVAKGHRYSETPAVYSKFTAFDGAPQGRQYVRVIGTQRRVDIVDPAGTVISTDSKKPIAVNALTVWQGGKWFLYDMG